MIRRAIIVGFGAIIGMRIVARMSHEMRKQMNHKMREHCKQMVAHCKPMTGQFEGRGEAVGRT